MALHKDLTGTELHEPKGADTAAAGTVYVANGSGSGTWTDRYNGVYNLNTYFLNGTISDISTPNSHVRFFVPTRSEIVSLSAILDGAITTADATLSIYINGVLFADNLVVTNAGSSAGSAYNKIVVTANTLDPGSVIEVRSDGASDTAVPVFVQVSLKAKT